MATALNAVSYANNKSANIDAENISTIVKCMDGSKCDRDRMERKD